MMRVLGPVLMPLIRLLLARGLDYSWFYNALKGLFIDEARRELARSGQRETDSAISLLSGVHRKDVRQWRRDSTTFVVDASVPPSAQVFARWVQEPRYRDSRKRPKALPRVGRSASFESLARSVTRDVHPFTVLAELIRLNLVRVAIRRNREYVVPNADGFIPHSGSKEMLNLFSANLADHASVAVANVLGVAPQLEQSVFASGLAEGSAKQLAQTARRLWTRARADMIAEASRLYARDRKRPGNKYRMRFGAYYFSDAGLTQPAKATAAREQGDSRDKQ